MARVRNGVFDISIEYRDGRPSLRVDDERGNSAILWFDYGLVSIQDGYAILAAALRNELRRIDAVST